jgi:hypothetical protein
LDWPLKGLCWNRLGEFTIHTTQTGRVLTLLSNNLTHRIFKRLFALAEAQFSDWSLLWHLLVTLMIEQFNSQIDKIV